MGDDFLPDDYDSNELGSQTDPEVESTTETMEDIGRMNPEREDYLIMHLHEKAEKEGLERTDAAQIYNEIGGFDYPNKLPQKKKYAAKRIDRAVEMYKEGDKIEDLVDEVTLDRDLSEFTI